MSEPVTLIELGHASFVVPSGVHVVYASCSSHADMAVTAKRDLLPVAEKLFRLDDEHLATADTRPRLVWSCFFNQSAVAAVQDISGLSNVHVTNSPMGDCIDYGAAIHEVLVLVTAIKDSSLFCCCHD